MTDMKSEIVVYSGADPQGELAVAGEPVTARNAPAIVKVAGRSARIYDRRRRKVTRNIVERISI